MPLPPGVDLAAYRIVQESLTNVAQARRADARPRALRYDDRELTLELTRSTTTGTARRASTAAATASLGMRERVALYGGRSSAGPRPGGGFRVRARTADP